MNYAQFFHDMDPARAALGALGFLVAALALLFLILLVRWRGREDSLLIAALRVICTLYVRAVHRLRVLPAGADPLPREGPAIVVANHRSGVDPLLIGTVTRRRVRFLMAREYHDLRGLRWAFRKLGCIPVNRDGRDLGATKAALKALRAGQVIGIFPQGGIREAEGSFEGKAGAALLALRTGAPVVPFYIHGSPNLDSVFRAIITPSRTTVVHGEAVRFGEGSETKPSRDELERVTSSIFGSISALRPALTGPKAL